MSTTVVKKGQPGNKAWFKDSFVLHKLHSLSGVIPIGLFLAFHLTANSYSLRGETEFNTVVKAIGYLPFVTIVEIVGIFVPILFHSIYGFMITSEMSQNIGTYKYGRNWLYSLQRWSGVIAFAYLVFHTTDTTFAKYAREISQGHEVGFNSISYDAMALRFSEWWYLAIYIVGVTTAVFHFANGMFNFCIRWGITIGDIAQKVSAAIWLLIGGALLTIGLWTAINFAVKGNELRNNGVTMQQILERKEAATAASPAGETQNNSRQE